MSAESISVSVVVPTLNSASVLENCLNSVRAQTLAPEEIVVSDNFSSDRTREIAETLGATVLQVGNERSAQRNAGARIARGTHLLFIDSDMLLHPGVIEACARQASLGFDAIVIPETVVGDSLWARSRDLEKRLCDGIPGYEAARFIHARLFWAVGGYDPSLVAGEDFDLHMSLEDAGATIGRVDTPINHVESSLRLHDYVRKWRYYASTLAPLVTKRGEARRRVPTIIEVTLRRRSLVRRHPREFAGLVLLKMIEFSVLGWRIRLPRLRRSRQ